MLSDLMEAQRLVTVVSVGGMGKTRLVIEACRRRHPDGGVWFVDLALAQSDGAVVDEVASVFGLQAAPGKSVEAGLIEYLESRTAVVVFDNCEHVMRPAAGLIDRLLHACPTLKVVATSREALLLRGEHVMALGPLSMDDSGDDDSAADAVELFIERLTAEAGPPIVGDDQAVVLEICRRLDGMPLSIELAAARARTLGVSGVLARLGERLRLLSGGWRTGAGRQHTLLATLDWSYVLLDERERVVFDRLAVFVGWFTLDDAVAVAADPGLDELEVLDALSALVDKSMCTVDLNAAPARYRYLETMRSYGRDHLTSAGTIAEYRNRHAAHISASARCVVEALVGPDELEASRQAERLIADLRAALGWAVDQHLDDVIDAIAPLAGLMALRGSYEMSGWFYELRDDLHDRVPVQETAIGHALNSEGDLAEARRLCQRLLEMTGDTSHAAWSQLGLVEFFESHFDRAVDCHRRAYAISEQQTDDRFLRVIGSVVLAVILAATGRDACRARRRGPRARPRRKVADRSGVRALRRGTGDPPYRPGGEPRGEQPLRRDRGRGRQPAREATAQTIVNFLQSALLPRADLALALIRQLRHLEQSGDTTTTALLTLSQIIELLNGAGRQRPAALICGWLDGRSGRNLQTLGDHEAAVTAIRHAVGDEWDLLFQRGRGLTSSQVFDIAFDELNTIE